MCACVRAWTSPGTGITGLVALTELRLAGNNLSVLKDVDHLSSLANLVCLNMTANPFCDLPHYSRCDSAPRHVPCRAAPAGLRPCSTPDGSPVRCV